MLPAPEPYGTACGVEAAIREAARIAARATPTLDASRRIQLEYFNRFLSRIFSEGDRSGWVLKGGAGMLVRVPSTRSTRDIDLYRQGLSLESALTDLLRLAAVDLGDHFRFEYLGHATAIAADTQPYTEGCRVTFAIYVGVAQRGRMSIDLAVGVGVTAGIQVLSPETALPLPWLVSHSYRLYPVVDQIADKVWASLSSYEGRPSSREKDLVDLVVLTVTQTIDGAELCVALATERLRRRIGPVERFVVPSSWGSGYAKLSRVVPQCADYPSVHAASELVARLIDPALGGKVRAKSWSPQLRSWS